MILKSAIIILKASLDLPIPLSHEVVSLNSRFVQSFASIDSHSTIQTPLDCIHRPNLPDYPLSTAIFEKRADGTYSLAARGYFRG